LAGTCGYAVEASDNDMPTVMEELKMLQEQRVYDEKRNFIRMKINTLVQVRSDDKEFMARCKDLSGSGMLILAEQALTLGSTVEVCIEPETEKQQRFRASGEVVRVDPVNPSGYILGLALTAIHD
ncbi:MAG TPA: PilZ domain-containing protein, partial [Spongiibacteraceae bacterium]|nr:PilZ domain-containing protein [Spongiibacteraceae bacterium]